MLMNQMERVLHAWAWPVRVAGLVRGGCRGTGRLLGGRGSSGAQGWYVQGVALRLYAQQKIGNITPPSTPALGLSITCLRPWWDIFMRVPEAVQVACKWFLRALGSSVFVSRPLQCFDLESYLQLNCERGTWRCPVCK